MLSLDELSRQIAAYSDRRIRVADFEDWFRCSSWGCYDHQGESVSDAIAFVEAALSSYEAGEIDEDELRWELATATAPFAQEARVYGQAKKMVYGDSLLKATVASPLLRLVFAVA